MDKNDVGILLTPDIKLQRKYFNQMVKLIGVYVMYQHPISKDYTLHGELDARYSDPVRVACIFEDMPNQKTTSRLGWDAELQENASIIHLPYDLEALQVGCLVQVPSAYDNTPGRKFRITKLSAIPIYPATIACEIVPEYANAAQKSEVTDFHNSNFNLLYEGD